MRYLVLTDVHANLEALEAVVADAPEHDGVLFLGDLVGYGPDPNACVATVRDLPSLVALAGNHDWAALNKVNPAAFNSFARQAVEWTAGQLEPGAREWLDSLEPKTETEDMALAHGSPTDPIWEYLEDASQGPTNFRAFSSTFCLVGHTHIPRVFVERPDGGVEVLMPEADQTLSLNGGNRFIINPGGVGQPRNGDPRAAYGILDTEANTFTFRRIPYAVGVTEDKIRAAGLPAALGNRLRFGI
jgi:diadenosine tetraphosphatase ApaH/serine/threonine PP2A family protein phosphatase